MPTFDYTEMREVAEELLEEFGQAAVLLTPVETGPEWERVTSWDPAPVTVLDIEQFTTPADSSSDQLLIRKVFISTRGLAVGVSSDNRLTIGGKTHPIQNVANISPGGLTLIWEARLGAAVADG